MRSHIVLRAAFLAALAAGAAGSSSCTSAVRQGDGSSFLIIDSIVGFSGPDDEETGNNLQSDVLTDGGVIEDEGIVQLRLALKDPGSATIPTLATTNNFITVTQYHVVFIRTDGRNTPGVDVPWPFDGAVTGTVRAEGTTSFNFPLVRVQAKQESPLAAMAGGGGAGVISTIAEITFFGKDQAGRAVSVTGRISVDFADFADPE
jgi:hypothetical protein